MNDILRRVTAAIATAGVLTLSLATISIAAGDGCGARNFWVLRGSAYCAADETSVASAAGPNTFATALVDSVARVTSRDVKQDSANAQISSTAIVRKGGTAIARSGSSATATNGEGNATGNYAARTIAEAVQGGEAEADGPGSKAYANGAGSVAIATNGGCAESWDGTTAIADGPGSVDLNLLPGIPPEYCPLP